MDERNETMTAQSSPGWSLPLYLDDRGRFSSEREFLLEDTVRLVLEVRPGERPLLPEFGCRIHSLHSLGTEGERQVAAALAEEALERWVPWLGVERVEVVGVAATSLRLAVYGVGERREVRIAWRGRKLESVKSTP